LLPPFAEAERQYADLCARCEAGELDQDGLRAELQKLTVLAEDGAYWSIGEDGEWYRYEDQEWVRREPPVVEAPAEPDRLRQISQPIVTTVAHEPLPETAEPEAAPRPMPRKDIPWRWVSVGCGGTLVLAAVIVGALALTGVLPFRAATPAGPEPTGVARQVAAAAPTSTTAASVLPTATLEPAPVVQDTPTVAPTRMPVDAYFDDDFSDSASGWEGGDYDSGSVGYGDGYYSVVATNPEKPMWGRAFRHLADVTVDLEADAVSGPTSGEYGFGVGCRIQPSGDGYYFLISADGLCGIFRSTGKRYRSLVDWVPSSAARTGQRGNRLRVMCDGPALAMVVNGVLVASATDATYAEGDIALQAWTGGDEPAEVHFENLLTEPPVTAYLPMVSNDS
jgi:hypothetical protein